MTRYCIAQFRDNNDEGTSIRAITPHGAFNVSNPDDTLDDLYGLVSYDPDTKSATFIDTEKIKELILTPISPAKGGDRK